MTALRFIHTAEILLGMPLARYGASSRLRVARRGAIVLLEEIGTGLAYSEDAVLDLARGPGIARLSAGARKYLGQVVEWHSTRAPE